MAVGSTTLPQEVALKAGRLGTDPAGPTYPPGGGREDMLKDPLFPSLGRTFGPRAPFGPIRRCVRGPAFNLQAQTCTELQINLVE